ncbi:MAG: N-acetylmuramic acid 6-phosphate etherase, partial [Acidobacteria bacterium]
MKGATKKPRTDLGRLVTEKPNPVSANLDLKPSLQLARIINSEDAKVAAAVKRALPQIAQSIDII